MNSPVIRYTMAILFTIVAITFTFILAGLVAGQWLGAIGMMLVVVLAGVGWWLVAMKLFRLGKP